MDIGQWTVILDLKTIHNGQWMMDIFDMENGQWTFSIEYQNLDIEHWPMYNEPSTLDNGHFSHGQWTMDI